MGQGLIFSPLILSDTFIFEVWRLYPVAA